MLSKSKILLVAVATLSVLMSHVSAYAGPAQASTAVNVRSGPGTKYQVVDTLHAGEVVDATECNQYRWCYVKHDGADGWVSGKFLTAVRQNNGGTQGKNCKFTFKLDQNGPVFSSECDEPSDFSSNGNNTGNGNDVFDDQDDIVTFNPQQNGAEATVCLYTGINYTGAEICEGISIHNNLRGMNDVFASVKVYNGAAVKLCTGPSFTGECKTYAQDRARLHTSVYKSASSMQIFAQFQTTVAKPQLPNESHLIANYLQGQAVLRQTQRLDLDTGLVGRTGADLQYLRAGNGRLYLRTLNGAAMAIGRRNERGFIGCNAARYNSQQVSTGQMPVGSFICVQTNEGRKAQFRVNQITDQAINIGFETYK
ncbi:MAG: SH3 domain-containing protein [OCS116 cluster bacterium]|nr:SH3 domain-containing protein [OCS116 cluster bacterium]